MTEEINHANGGAPLWNPAVRWGAFSPKSVHRDVMLSAAAARGVAVERFDNQVFRLSHLGRSVLFHGHMPDTTSFVARTISNSKHQTKFFLKEAGISFPEGQIFEVKDIEAAWTYAKSLGLPTVVKPLSGSGGDGVTSDINDKEHFELAWRSMTPAIKRVVEKHIRGTDYRLMIIGDRFIAATLRVPAFLIGDGQSTVSELIEAKNKARALNPYVGGKPIKATENILRTLRKLGLTLESVLKADRTVQLHAVANIGAGGDSIDVTHMVHPDFADIAVRAGRSIPGAFHAGVDLLVDDITKPAAGQTYGVCEVNTRPDVALHHFPLQGPARDAAGVMIEAMFPLARLVPKEKWVTKSLSLTGKVTGVGLRKKIEHLAAENSLAGWVKNNDDGTVSAIISGPPIALNHVIDVLRKRPSTRVNISDHEGEIPDDFRIHR